jgi:recombination associated protein RdgC
VFKNLMVYRLAPEWQPTLASIETALDGARFVECGATQPRAIGWVPPRNQDHAPLIEAIDGQWLLQLMVETKLVPGSVVKRQVETLAERIEKTTGRKPGKKETRELKDQALLDLLPMAFTKRGGVKVWISPTTRLLVIDAGSASRADETLTALTQVLPGLSAQLINTAVTPQAAMADWLVSGEPPTPFTIDRDVELKAADGEKPVVRYARHALDLPEIREHIAAGKRPTRLALTWNDRVSFVLTEGLQLKKISFLDGVFEGRLADGDEGFDANAAIATGELAPMIGELIAALGGEQALGVAAPVPGAAPEAPAALPASTLKTAPKAPPITGDLPPWEAASA